MKLSENKEYSRSELLDLSDAEIGALCRQFISQIDDWANKQWATKADVVVGLGFMACAQLIKQARDCNAGTLTLTMSEVTLEGGDAGDWRVHIEQIKAPKSEAA